MHVFRKGILPGLNQLRQGGFCKSIDHQAFMEYVGGAVVFPYVQDDVRKGSHGLKRYSGHGVECRFVPESLFREAENHYRRCAEVVDDDFAGVRNRGLGLVDVQHLQSSRTQDPVYHLELAFVFVVLLAATQLCESRLSDVILCWSEASCRNHYVVVGQFLRQDTDDLFSVVSHGYHS